MKTPRYRIQYEPRVDWSPNRWKPNKRRWGVERHYRGCWVKLGSRGFSLWWRNVR